MEFWIEGIPATYSTRLEREWKDLLGLKIPNYDRDTYTGKKISWIKLKFILPVPSSEKRSYNLDLDNLCHPVFSVLITKKGWFEGKRPKLEFWYAMKINGESPGLKLSLETVKSIDLINEFGKPFFDNIYEGKLPSNATDPKIPTWLNTLGNFKLPNENERLIIWLQFGGTKRNIGEIPDGPVKHVIDCLYPIIGGPKGNPNDHIVDILQVEKSVPNLSNDMVRICIWKREKEELLDFIQKQ